MGKHVLFVCYWSIADGLTVSTVFPSLVQLEALSSVSKVYLVTIERGDFALEGALVTLPPKGVHSPFMVKGNSKTYRYVQEFLLLPRNLEKLVIREKINFIIARGAPAGTVAHVVSKKCNVPYYVESYEPHADYMADSGVWSRTGLKYIYQKKQERKQNVMAAGLMPVAESFKQQLISEGVPASKIVTVPCVADPDFFQFNRYERERIRENLRVFRTTTVGVYVGKYGGLYMEDETFRIYKKCFALIPDFKLIILSPNSKEYIQKKLLQHSIEQSKVYVAAVPHHEVPAYLSAADFAFATYKPGPSKKYLSPVKIGEYWANGLPVLLTEGVGDDSDIIKNEGGGAVFNLTEEGSLEKALDKIQQILKDTNHRQEIPNLARKYRSPDKIKEAYEYFFGRGQEEQS
ncbi:glycosyltransferase [Pontibacter harenae]|uniref:glycosyltransferase n=1 Tax=Pontibacter harenae TaxID=2894083 RepID=UPI001E389D36|nr:glycosyltransferase [Pontibacter harenae]